MRYNQSFKGITSGHVVGGQDSYQDNSVDVAFVDIDVKANKISRPFNNAELSIYCRCNIGHYYRKIKEVLVMILFKKVGRSSGLTTGKLISANLNVGMYESHVAVSWNQGRFATSGDSGSLYCVKRGQIYIPIGIHRASDGETSCGCQIWDAMQLFPAEDSCYIPIFANPPASSCSI